MATKKRTTKKKLQQQLMGLGVRLPHGYEVVKRTPKKKKATKKKTATKKAIKKVARRKTAEKKK